MENKEFEISELKDLIMKEGDEIRKSLLDKLFNLNTLILILLYQVYGLRILGSVYNKLENWKEEDLNYLSKKNVYNFYIILIAISLTLIEVGYLFFIFLN